MDFKARHVSFSAPMWLALSGWRGKENLLNMGFRFQKRNHCKTPLCAVRWARGAFATVAERPNLTPKDLELVRIDNFKAGFFAFDKFVTTCRRA